MLLFFAFIIYHQMLLINEVNKRLMLMTKESIDKERMTQDNYMDLLNQYNDVVNEQTISNNNKETNINDELGDMDEPFDPHNY